MNISGVKQRLVLEYHQRLLAWEGGTHWSIILKVRLAMNRLVLIFIFLFSALYGQNTLPADFWIGNTQEEKIAFINGAYGAIAKMKSHHKSEVRKQYMHDDNWVEPYYIERFYQIADEYLSDEVGYNLKIIAMHMDAFYTNSDNLKIPVMEALRVVSLMQDGERKTANARLLRAQQKHNK